MRVGLYGGGPHHTMCMCVTCELVCTFMHVCLHACVLVGLTHHTVTFVPAHTSCQTPHSLTFPRMCHTCDHLPPPPDSLPPQVSLSTLMHWRNQHQQALAPQQQQQPPRALPAAAAACQGRTCVAAHMHPQEQPPWIAAMLAPSLRVVVVQQLVAALPALQAACQWGPTPAAAASCQGLPWVGRTARAQQASMGAIMLALMI